MDHCRCVAFQVELVQKQSIWGYHFGKQSPFLKITMASPPLVRA
jgi:hypothetical protein